ncbi:hypothetical protein PUNSTDRAFT_105049 [Punctularia strigosozonata HHB-11173 SS5]|uniref:uncharacterized protein n=1 Tax=Punctularia strigosozonata (strain HHB-11173) TaxID=741275 RepID=UPI000441737E|nr:uncharacterized protein PUNSTDRAFT_105049 [Punctularia strigosozonata HHB-11173 SS5]EIN07367.1 hypothetical protein PUNSTDRAFT_105049 [Punctularia strigosozonata HHB-11173 SS5]
MLPQRTLRLSRASRIPPVTHLRPAQIILRRNHGSDSRSSTPTSTQGPPRFDLISDALNEAHWGLEYFRRFIKFLLITSIAAGTIAGVAWEGAHLWVEYVGLAAEADPEAKKWQWDKEMERWSGTESGTDTALGIWARHAVRSAWTSMHWGTGVTGKAAHSAGPSSSTNASPRGSGLNAVEFELEFAHDALAKALEVAMQKQDKGKLHPRTIPQLHARHAGVLEAMGVPAALVEAREELEQALRHGQWDVSESARVAWKLGDLNQRLHDGEEAKFWWLKSIELSGGGSSPSSNAPVAPIPQVLPPSPFDQRTLASALVSLSAFYSQTGNLKQARSLQEDSLKLLSSFPALSASTSSPAQTLHTLYLAHRTALLRVHLAEVSYALRSSSQTSLALLQDAARASERVALTLTGLPLVHPDAPTSSIPHPPSSDRPLLPSYQSSPSMSAPAKGLLRDARRSASEAWNLMGVVIEAQAGQDTAKARDAMECYERALGWIGWSEEKQEAGEGILEAEWKTIWRNYVRTRDFVRKETPRK